MQFYTLCFWHPRNEFWHFSIQSELHSGQSKSSRLWASLALLFVAGEFRKSFYQWIGLFCDALPFLFPLSRHLFYSTRWIVYDCEMHSQIVSNRWNGHLEHYALWKYQILVRILELKFDFCICACVIFL